ncbi:MAG: pyruvate dehydrogenase (acetyl-transferring) E1 component subunit alpha [Verrucomicrobiales bacterium]
MSQESSAPGPDPSPDLDMLTSMLEMRAFEERAAQQYQLGKIGGFCHLYIGQEAVAAGSFAAIRADDDVITAYRDHAHALGRGTSMRACMAELFGKATGCSKGLGGSMHFFDKERHMYGGHAIVGAHIPVALGIAFAAKYRHQDRLTLCYFGDGSIHQGAFHEAFNLASLWELPVILICENNGYAMGTAVHRSTALEEIHHRGRGYDMDHSAVDGMDVRAVRDAVRQIAGDIRANSRPHFLEARTYRYRGHSMSDPATYRSKQEVDERKQDDPINNFRDILISEGSLTEEGFKELQSKAREEAAESVSFADSSPDPPLEQLHDYTYARTP